MPVNRNTTEQNTRSNTYRLHEFDPTSYDWDDWEILFDTYLAVKCVTDDIKKRNLLITALGVQPFKTLISVCKPNKPTECTYEEIIQKLRTNYARVTFSSTERINFFATRQESSQTLTDFSNRLRDKTVTCKFPNDFYEEALVTAFVGGLKNEFVRKHLMQQNLEAFEQTLNVARTFESVLIQGANVKRDPVEQFSVLKIQKKNKLVQSTRHKVTCSSCGSMDHPRSQCRFRNVTYHKCNKEGHLAKGCLKIDEAPIGIPIKVDGLVVTFELNTGSPITIINEHVWNTLGKPKLKPIESIFTSFTGHYLQINGETLVKVDYNSQHMQLRLLVGHNHRNILGRDWIKALNLNKLTLDDILFNDNKILNVNPGFNSLDQLIHHFAGIFKDELGCCKIKAHLHIKNDIKSKFFKARSLPFAYRQAVELDLNRLVSANVLEPINTANWAAPIVVVPKPGGKVRLCADFSTGVNQALDIDQYPLPKPNDLFVSLNGGIKF
ncbi:unnamed protein product, partial [Rotaria magnacalcarata]